MRDLTGIQQRTDSKGRERFRGYVKERGKNVWGPWGEYADAKAWRARAIATKLEGGAVVKPGGPTILEASAHFLHGIESHTILSRKGIPYAPSTVRDYRHAFRQWINPELGHIPVATLRRSQVQRWVDWAAMQRGGGTTRNVFHALAALYTYLLPRYDELNNPTDGVKIPRPSKARERYARPEEMEALLAPLPHHLALPYALAFYAGLRRGEIRALRAMDVEGQWIHVRRSLDPVAGFGLPKNGTPRAVPIFTPLEPFIAEALRKASGSSLLVTTTSPSRFGARDLSHHADVCDRYWKPLGLQRIGLHEGRHSFATMLVRAGYDIALVSEWVGHGDPATTLRIYVKREGQAVRDIEKMDTYLMGAR
jgi:integrase